MEHSVPTPAIFPEVAPSAALGEGGDFAALMDLNLSCYFELGGTTLSVREILGLSRGSVITLNRLVGEPGIFVVAGKPFAEGEVVALESGSYGIRITRVLRDHAGAGANS
jgi:flagellar motor switch/type III secretory pathway protein FliN